MPTTLELAGLDPDEGRALDGRSMVAPLRSGDWRHWRRRLMCENPKLGWAMLREGDLAYIDYYAQGETELYDLARDPYQLRSIPATASSTAAAERARSHADLAALRVSAGRALRTLEM